MEHKQERLGVTGSLQWKPTDRTEVSLDALYSKIDADRDEGVLAVGIRTFWAARGEDGGRVLRFGTGAGITWGSTAVQEWEETELKAARLLALASRDRRTSGSV